MRRQLLSVVAVLAAVVGWLIARHFVRSGHPYVGVLVMFVIGLAIGATLVPILRGVARRH